VRKNRDLVELGWGILRARRARGLRQWQLADMSGLNINYIGGIERAERNPGMASIFKLARALSVHPADLMATIP
jgi:transcriptional regulator with XRE-family HTH domain